MNKAEGLTGKNMKDYNIILKQERAEILKQLLKENGISYEMSDCYDIVYISITATEEQVQAINKELERLFD